jgi:hypothetical protein
MSEVEFVWVQECEVCGREHRHMECHAATSRDEILRQEAAFRERCANWYQGHLETLQARQLSVRHARVAQLL